MALPEPMGHPVPDHRTGVVLGYVDGMATIQAIVSTCPMRRLEALRLLYELHGAERSYSSEPRRKSETCVRVALTAECRLLDRSIDERDCKRLDLPACDAGRAEAVKDAERPRVTAHANDWQPAAPPEPRERRARSRCALPVTPPRPPK
jgi:hypothetical protein